MSKVAWLFVFKTQGSLPHWSKEKANDTANLG